MSLDVLVLVARALPPAGLAEAAELAATLAAFERRVQILATGPASESPWPSDSLQLLADSGVVLVTGNETEPSALIASATTVLTP